jgi:formate hydrogenlyase transcriptional activator
VAAQVAVALDNARSYREIAQLTEKLASEKLYLEEEIRTELNFEEIVGESPALKRVLSQARTVAPSDATVLILGDTGTGKELIARAIHRMSGRKERVFVKLNCAAIPTGLLESELFGHEKGAFTGAISQKVGRLELADKGSLFLDEVGDIPLELQPKLLRVLQDQEFERLGSIRTIKVDIRMIAATNRDLARIVAEKEFRNDLYYRLNVFPIRMPSLNERKTDIPSLVRHFVQKFSRKMNKQIDSIPSTTMNALVNWEWPVVCVSSRISWSGRSFSRRVRCSTLLWPSWELEVKAWTVMARWRTWSVSTLFGCCARLGGASPVREERQ